MTGARICVVASRRSGVAVRQARSLVDRLPEARWAERPDPAASLHCHLDAATFRERVSELEVGLYRGGDLDVALRLDGCFATSESDAARLRAASARAVWPLGSEEVDGIAGVLRKLAKQGAVEAEDPEPGPLRIRFSTDAGEARHRGGPSVRMEQTASALRRLGHEVVSRDDDGPVDVVHLFNSWPPDSCLARLEAARATGSAVVLSPIYMDHREAMWMRRALRRAFPRKRRRRSLVRAVGRASWVPRALRVRSTSDVERYRDALPRMIELADHVILLSHAELRGLRALGCEPRSRSFVWNAVESAPFVDADPALFRREHGLGPEYVLCVGRVEFRKNQAMLVEALRETDLEIVLVGSCLDPAYGALVDAVSGPRVRPVKHLSAGNPLLASAFAGASAFALPSWAEGAPIAALEAAAAGCPLVLGNRTGEREYFGALARYCDPASLRSVRGAVEAAIAEDTPVLRARRQGLVARKLRVDAAARSTVRAYARALAARGARPS